MHTHRACAPIADPPQRASVEQDFAPLPELHVRDHVQHAPSVKVRMIQALLQAGELRTCRRSRPMSTFCCALAKLMSLSNSLGLMACSMCVHAPHFTMMSTRHQEPGHRSRGYGLHPHCSRPHWRTRVGCAPRHASAQAACRSSPVRYAGREEGRKGGSQGAREPGSQGAIYSRAHLPRPAWVAGELPRKQLPVRLCRLQAADQ